ncbi:22.3 kDa class VI heat shock protein isoform X2 [Asparagus officinalis]|uniref:22.3 kDa class VI heat shock protein isoform X2 n=1 Tax=Asparagus officinalis TaxID=4686 RepID=UPI00098E60EE|nr:22.3 kDa class VI heat shock protein isoform X2 [Asparagus officinalis]
MASSLCHCPAMTPRRVLEVQLDDQNSQKWRVSLTEDAFSTFINHGGDPVKRVFGEGSFFSPLLFGKFFDPADAFPLWEFESEALLSGLRSASKTSVDWVETDVEYVVRAELPGARKIEIEVCAEKEKVLEISGQWKSRESNVRDWRTGHWWEHGFVRRLELPGDANWRRIEAYIDNEIFLEIKIPKNISGVEPKESECV